VAVYEASPIIGRSGGSDRVVGLMKMKISPSKARMQPMRTRSTSLSSQTTVFEEWDVEMDPANKNNDVHQKVSPRWKQWQTATANSSKSKCGQYPIRISTLCKEDHAHTNIRENAPAEWVISGLSEKDSQNWARAIVHNAAVLKWHDENNYKTRGRETDQWDRLYTAQAKVALSMVLRQARRGDGSD